MGDYGFFGGLNGYINSGFSAFTLLAHGRAYASNAKKYFLSDDRGWTDNVFYFYEFDYPEVKEGSIVIPFFFVEKDNKRSSYTLDYIDKVNRKIYIVNLKDTDPPYIYIYTNDLSKIPDEEYGVEIFNDKKERVFHSGISPLKMLKTIDLFDDVLKEIPEIHAKEIAITTNGNDFRVVWFPNWTRSDVQQRSYHRSGNKIDGRVKEWSNSMEGAGFIGVDLREKSTAAIIDVSHIKRKG